MGYRFRGVLKLSLELNLELIDFSDDILDSGFIGEEHGLPQMFVFDLGWYFLAGRSLVVRAFRENGPILDFGIGDDGEVIASAIYYKLKICYLRLTEANRSPLINVIGLRIEDQAIHIN